MLIFERSPVPVGRRQLESADSSAERRSAVTGHGVQRSNRSDCVTEQPASFFKDRAGINWRGVANEGVIRKGL
jgi:hypothetical protein